jgi:MFS family permease
MSEMFSLKRKRVILFVCSLAYFIANLDTTIVNVALPAIAQDYGITLISTRNVLIIFSFMYGISIPIGSYLSDKFGVKRIFIIAAVVFGLSSLMCGLSRNIMMLEIMRAVQGVSAAFFTPVARSIIIKYSTKETIVNNMANVMSVGLLAQTIGPFVGGMITAHSSWKWVFFVNVPFCIFAIVLAVIYLKNIKEEKVGKLDIFSFVSITLAISSFLYICEYVAAWNIDAVKITVVVLILAVSSVGYYLYSKRKPVNIINTALFRDKIFRDSTIISIITRHGLSAMSFVFVIILSHAYGFSDEKIGNILLFYGLGIWLSKFLIPVLTKYIKIQKLIYYASISIFCWLLVIAALTYFKFVPLFIVSLTLLGLSSSLYYGYLNGLGLQRIDKSDSSQGSTILSLVIYICQSSSVSIFSIFFILSKDFTDSQVFRLIISVLLMSMFVLAAIIFMNRNKAFMNYKDDEKPL